MSTPDLLVRLGLRYRLLTRERELMPHGDGLWFRIGTADVEASADLDVLTVQHADGRHAHAWADELEAESLVWPRCGATPAVRPLPGLRRAVSPGNIISSQDSGPKHFRCPDCAGPLVRATARREADEFGFLPLLGPAPRGSQACTYCGSRWTEGAPRPPWWPTLVARMYEAEVHPFSDVDVVEAVLVGALLAGRLAVPGDSGEVDAVGEDPVEAEARMLFVRLTGCRAARTKRIAYVTAAAQRFTARLCAGKAEDDDDWVEAVLAGRIAIWLVGAPHVCLPTWRPAAPLWRLRLP